MGNTDILVSRILEGAREGGAAAEEIFLRDLAIGECDGCLACGKGAPCVRDDDMNRLYAKVAGCDGIVFGTPLYWYGPTALMKAFLDRFFYFNCPAHRPKIKGTRAALAVPLEEGDSEAAAPLQTMFERSFRYLEMEFVGSIVVPGVGPRGEILKKKTALEKARRLGGMLAR